MSKVPPPSPALTGLGSRLRAIREEAELSGIELADVLGTGWRQSKVSKIETGRQLPSVPDVTAWAAATHADPAPLLALRAKSEVGYTSWRERTAAAGGTSAVQEQLAALQASCTFLAAYQPALIPGRLQIPAYMREMMTVHDDDAHLTDGVPPERNCPVILLRSCRTRCRYRFRR